MHIYTIYLYTNMNIHIDLSILLACIHTPKKCYTWGLKFL